MPSFLSQSVIVSIALSLLSTTSALVIERTAVYTEPPCSVPFTPYLYAGCYTDPSSPRALPFAPAGYDTRNSTVEKCIAQCKGNGYRYAGLEYYGECFCGNSIAGEAADPSQCKYPCSGNKSQTCGANDILSVYMDPTFPPTDANDISDYTPEGCYTESGYGRAVVYRQNQLATATLTTEKCLLACKSQNYPLAATEYGSECYCGVVLGNGTASAPAKECNMPCRGNASQICGGPSRLNLYVAKDLMSSEPCGPFVLPPPVATFTPPAQTTSGKPQSTIPVKPQTTSQAQQTSSTEPQTTTSTEAESTTSVASQTTTPVKPETTTYTEAESTSPVTPQTTTPVKPETTSTEAESTTSVAPQTTTPVKPESTSTTSTTSITSPTKCTSTTPAPTCEYQCGKWCSKPLSAFLDHQTCKVAVAECILQIADCFLTAGWPASLQCAKFQSWCESVSTYCSNTCQGKSCSKSDCVKKNPPVATTPAPTPGVCSASTTTTAKATTSTAAPIPTVSSICVLPHGPAGSGYSNGACVGGIQPPALTCNNLLFDFGQHPFKLYTDKDSTKCGGYSMPNVAEGCKDACEAQYNSCLGTYAEGCKGKKEDHGQDSYDSAKQKCKNQYQDCLKVNSDVSAGNRCMRWGVGWS